MLRRSPAPAVTLVAALPAVAALVGCSSSTTTTTQQRAAPTLTSSAPTQQPNPTGTIVSSPTYTNPRSQQTNPWATVTNSSSNVRAASNDTPTPMFGLFGEIPAAGAQTAPEASRHDATHNLVRVSYADEGADFDPALSRDGKQVVFASTRHRPTADIYVQTVGGTSVTQLTNDPAHDVMPALSPDGSRVAFASNRDGNWNLYIMNAAGGQAVQLTSDTSHELHPSWSPDGERIVYCRLNEQSDRWEIWTVDADKPGAQTFVTFGLFPEWHPSEDAIVFQRSRERGDRFFGVWTIELIDGQGVFPTEVVSSASHAVINPSWSVDGAFIACATVQNPQQNLASDARPQAADVWIVRRDGAARTNLTGGFYVNLMPTWGPDQQLMFVSDRGGIDNIWSVNPKQAMVAAGMDLPEADTFATVPLDD